MATLKRSAVSPEAEPNRAEDLEILEQLIPGIPATARVCSDVIESDGAHAAKAGPCAKFDGLEAFTRLRMRLDGCLTGSRLAKDRASDSLQKVMIPEALDYPALATSISSASASVPPAPASST